MRAHDNTMNKPFAYARLSEPRDFTHLGMWPRNEVREGIRLCRNEGRDSSETPARSCRTGRDGSPKAAGGTLVAGSDSGQIHAIKDGWRRRTHRAHADRLNFPASGPVIRKSTARVQEFAGCGPSSAPNRPLWAIWASNFQGAATNFLAANAYEPRRLSALVC